MRAVVMFGQVGIESMAIALTYIHKDKIVSDALANLFIKSMDFEDTPALVFTEGSQQYAEEIADILQEMAEEKQEDVSVSGYLTERLKSITSEDYPIIGGYEDSIFLELTE